MDIQARGRRGRRAAPALAWACFLLGAGYAQALIDPSPRLVQSAVMADIMTLIVLDATICLATSGFGPAIAILGLLIPTMLFGMVLRGT